MKATRREFIKQSSAAFSIAMLMPGLSISRPQQSGRKILALVQLGGGNDGLNTVIPYNSTLSILIFEKIRAGCVS